MRARNIKPAFFVNEDLTELPYEARLLFIGLWTLADREGRLADRPKRIKIELFPVDNIDIDLMLTKLAGTGFIDRYMSDGKSVISIGKFTKHQSPHGTEKDSELPDKDGFYTVNERKFNGVITGVKKLVNNKPPLNNVEITLNNVNLPLDNALNPECGILNPDLLNPEIKEHVNEDVHETVLKTEKYKDEIKNVFEYWKKVMQKRGTVILDAKRKSAIRGRLADGYTQEQLCKAIDGCSTNDHNMGRNPDSKGKFDDIELICRNVPNVDRFMDMAGPAVSDSIQDHDEVVQVNIQDLPRPKQAVEPSKVATREETIAAIQAARDAMK
jgi:hypothetical protein